MVRRFTCLQTKSNRRRNRIVSHRNKLDFIFPLLLTLLFSQTASSQVALGLYEGLMGNSGAAISDPTAASYYNPSLLSKKLKNSYSLGGNTVGSYTSKNENSRTSSFALNPSYLSNIMVLDSFVHEFFLANVSPTKIRVVETTTINNIQSRTETNIDQAQFIFGYTMAFKNIPFALSYFSQFNQINTVGFAEHTDLVGPVRSTSFIKSDLKSMGAGISVSGHAKLRNYTLGYQLRTRQVSMYKKGEGTVTTYTHAGTTPGDYSKTELSSSNTDAAELGSSIIVGHGFKNGDHEFLTDSHLFETTNLNYTYRLNQTFGYRMNSDSGHQLLCGFSHQIGPEITYFGQSAYYSVGYSWLSNTNRSVIGLYAFSSKLQQDIFAAGLTFGSEFSY